MGAMKKQEPERVERRLYVFAKPPSPGRVKTRLIPALGEEAAARLYQAFLSDLEGALRDGPYQLMVAWAVAAGEALPRLAGARGVAQSGGELGERLFTACRQGLAEAAAVVVVGSDCPELERTRVVEAFELLEAGRQVVLGPSPDGGYYLIGLRRDSLEPALFTGISWSTGAVLAETLERCRAAGLALGFLPELHDIDLPADLDALAERLRRDPAPCPATRLLLEEWGRL